MVHIQPRFPYKKKFPHSPLAHLHLFHICILRLRGDDHVNKFSLVRALVTVTMEACFLTSNSFNNKSIKIVPSAKPKSFAPHPNSDSALTRPKTSGSSLSIKCKPFEFDRFYPKLFSYLLASSKSHRVLDGRLQLRVQITFRRCRRELH